MHPTHSVCGLGAQADDLLGSHALDDTPCGPRSPFHRLPQVDGFILMLGCGLRPNTSMHAVEELVNPPYLFGEPILYTLVDEHGHTCRKQYTPHGFRGWAQRYDRISGLLTEPALRSGTVAGAFCHLIHAESLWSAALEALRNDPLFFVEATSDPHD
jgi:aminoglycoside 3-N-acetyltransferase